MRVELGLDERGEQVVRGVDVVVDRVALVPRATSSSTARRAARRSARWRPGACRARSVEQAVVVAARRRPRWKPISRPVISRQAASALVERAGSASATRPRARRRSSGGRSCRRSSTSCPQADRYSDVGQPQNPSPPRTRIAQLPCRPVISWDLHAPHVWRDGMASTAGTILRCHQVPPLRRARAHDDEDELGDDRDQPAARPRRRRDPPARRSPPAARRRRARARRGRPGRTTTTSPAAQATRAPRRPRAAGRASPTTAACTSTAATT